MLPAKTPGGYSARRDLKRGLISGHRQAARRNAAQRSWLEEKRSRGQRVLDGRSGALAAGRVL